MPRTLSAKARPKLKPARAPRVAPAPRTGKASKPSAASPAAAPILGTLPALAPAQIRKLLLTWYRAQRRDLPWRRTPTLYPVMLSEYMLQQTRVDQALPYYARFLDAFPTLPDLAAAPLDRVLKLWEGLGYYARARNLHKAAQHLVTKQLPAAADLDDCPGIGPYMRAAIGSIVFNEALPVIDGNVNRVLARVLALDVPPQDKPARARLLEVLYTWIDADAPGDFNQAVMELGALVCAPRSPSCLLCPLAEACAARKAGRPESYPLRLPKPARPHKDLVAAVIQRQDGRVLIAQRPATGLLASLWEFPTATAAKGEDLPAACARAAQEKVGLNVRIGATLASVEHGFTHFQATLHGFACTPKPGKGVSTEPRALGCQKVVWVTPVELSSYAFPRFQWKWIKELQAGRKKS